MTDHRHDRVPPHSEEAERGVLGCMLLDAITVLARAKALRVDENAFYVPAHLLLFATLARMVAENITVDILTAGEFLAARGDLEKIGGPAFLEKVLDAAGSVATADYFLARVRDAAIKRGVLRQAQEIQEEVYQPEIKGEQLLLSAPQRFTTVIEGVVREPSNLSVMQASVEEWERARRYEQEHDDTCRPAIGITTPFEDLTRLLCGLENGTLTVLAGRPSAGKTTLEDILSCHAALQGIPVARATMDSTHKTLLQRAICRTAGVSLPKMKFGHAKHNQIADCRDAAQQLEKLPLWINDQLYTIEAICSWAMMMKARRNIGLFTFDYIGLAGVESGNWSAQNQEVARVTYIARRFKQLAQELDIPVIALSQLSRSLEGNSKQGPRNPQLSDLRDSGEVEAAADKVIFVYVDRETKQKMENPAEGGRMGATKHKRPVWVEVAKHKNGECGALPFWLLPPYFRFVPAVSNELEPFADRALPAESGENQKLMQAHPVLIPQEECVPEPEERD